MILRPEEEAIDNFHLDLVRVTEAGAVAAAAWVGRGDKESADKAATDAMRHRLNQIDFCAEIAIGEGEKDESYGLFQGERVGWCEQEGDAQYEIAVDPIEGTTPTANGTNGAMSVIALANRGSFLKTDSFYMDKLAVGPGIHGVDIKNPPQLNVSIVAAQLKKNLNQVSVCVMNRPRHEKLIEQLRVTGCRIKLIKDCDVTACIATCKKKSDIDMYLGIGGSPEGVISAAAIKCMGGFFQAREWDHKSEKHDDKILEIEDLAAGPTMFAATGITDGKLLEGVRFDGRLPETNSVAMRSGSKTIRWMTVQHGN